MPGRLIFLLLKLSFEYITPGLLLLKFSFENVYGVWSSRGWLVLYSCFAGEEHLVYTCITASQALCARRMYSLLRRRKAFGSYTYSVIEKRPVLPPCVVDGRSSLLLLL